MTYQILTSDAVRPRHRVVEIKINADVADGNETETGWSVPASHVVLDCLIRVDTEDSGITVDVGTGGTSNDPDGFLDGVSLATAGLVKGTLLSSGQTQGALLRVDESGGGVLVPEKSIAAAGDAVTFTCSAATTARFSIIFLLLDLSA